MRRTSLLVVMLVLLSLGLVLPTAAAAPSPDGALRASFQAGFTGGNGVAYASFAHDSMAVFHAANDSIFDPGFTVEAGARRIIPGVFDQEYCDTNVFGIWWYISSDEKDDVADAEVSISFDGEELDLTYSAVKKSVNPQEFFFEGDSWWGSVGVPVYGTLEPGEYLVESTILFPDEPVFELEAVITITDC